MNKRDFDPIVIVGHALRLPGGVNSVVDYERLLFEGRSAIELMPDDRFDRDLYFDKKRGETGKSYTELGGCVSATPLDASVEQRIESLGTFDLAHRQFAQVAVKAWSADCLGVPSLSQRCGVYVGHSGGTDQGGPLAMSMLAETAIDHLRDVQAFADLPTTLAARAIDNVTKRVRHGRPVREDDSIRFNAYSAASLVSRLLFLGGPREVIDAACASSLLGLAHAVLAIQRGRIDAAIIGGATYNNVDNLILFSQSQACSDHGSSPFDDGAGGLISSEGYVAIAVTKLSIATEHSLPILGTINGIGVASDGRGKSLWAPRTEGQQLAIRRGYDTGSPLDIDYLEAHATSTQVGDATELQSLVEILNSDRLDHQRQVNGATKNGRTARLLVGSVKSNLGHTLEAAGLVGLVKLLIAMRRGEIPPTINFEKPNPGLEASSRNISVVARTTAWPMANRPRRGAVNAFGIGGLNGHAVVEQAAATASPASTAIATSKQSNEEPIAIVGRGLVLPGAFNVAAFAQLLLSETTSIGAPSSERWRDRVGLSSRLSPFHVPTNNGGYIHGYKFDGQPYRIPPKQVLLANPVQMMLIDAVAQAAQEADGGKWLGDRQRTSVVVGTIFGGEFSNQLQVGLRLPEVCRELIHELTHAGLSQQAAESIAVEYRCLMLKRYPALLDETGSFTASTLASRIAKSFDLMGGACAVDADDASGSLALMIAVDQLRAGTSDTVVCGVVQRSLDLVAFKDLELRDRLSLSGRANDIRVDCSQVLPGEGVAILMLRRLSDARRDNMQVLGLIDDFTIGTNPDAMKFRHSRLGEDPINHQIVKRVGYLAGAHSIVRLVAETVRWESSGPTVATITSTAEDGFYVTTSVRHVSADKKVPNSKPTPQTIPKPVPMLHHPLPNLLELSTNTMNMIDNGTHRIIRLEGADEAAFEHALRHAAETPNDVFQGVSSGRNFDRFSPQSRFRGGVVATSAKSLSVAVESLLKAWRAGKRSTVVDRHLALMWDRGLGNDRIAWAFPGQGAQYSAIPQVVSEDDRAKDFLCQFDLALTTVGQPAISGLLHDPEKQLGHDVWWTQLWVLAVSATLADSLARHGHRPDMVFGHSFGECGAALQAGVMTLPQAIRFAKQRSDAVVMTTRNRGQLLSIRGTPSRVDAILATLGTNICITHHNAPDQTVIAGSPDEIAIAREALTEASMAAIVIPVPAAFHSPALENARVRLRTNFDHERLSPPICGFFSTIQGRYVGEPDAIRDGLIDQLTQPLMYCSAIERVARDGCGLLIDVGPSDILTRLHRSIVGTAAICVSLDGNDRSHAQRMALVRLASECVGKTSVGKMGASFGLQLASTIQQIDHSEDSVTIEKPKSSLGNSDLIPEVIDVTRRSRTKPRPTQAAPINAAPINAAPIHSVVTSVNRVIQNEPVCESDLADQFLIDLVVELTGYSPDLIDFEADLEAELGVDSIKKAQIIGELAEWASLELDLRQMKLSHFHSLGDIRKLVVSEHQAYPIRSRVVERPTGESNGREFNGNEFNGNGSHGRLNGHLQVEPPLDIRVASSSRFAVAQIDTLMVDFIVDQTGYSPDLIDMDADLEGELGLDSIKKAQLLGELVSHYDLQDIDLRSVRLSNFPTLGSIRDFVVEHLSNHGSIATAEHKPHDSNAIPTNSAVKETARKKKMIRRGLRALVDAPTQESQVQLLALFDDQQLTEIRQQGSRGSSLQTIANDTGIRTESLWRWMSSGEPTSLASGLAQFTNTYVRSEASAVDPPLLLIPGRGTCRFGLKMIEEPRRAGMPTELVWNGPALIVGQNAIADAIEKRLASSGIVSHRIDSSLRSEQLETVLGELWTKGETPHLFLTTPHDLGATGNLSTTSWSRRRQTAILIPFRICQLWLQRMIDQSWMERASLVSVLNMGGDFGFSASQIHACESGAMAGLTKAMLIEAWMRGFQETPMKVIDVVSKTSVESIVDGIFRELAVPSHDEEVTVSGADRWAVRPDYQPLDVANSDNRSHNITRGGTWIVSGGGRGITALTSMALAEKHDLTLHLLGTAPAPDVSESIRQRAVSNRAELRREVISRAQQSGDNAIESWRDLEKAIEIDLTLAACEQRGIRAVYHSVDVSDINAVHQILDWIREQGRPIRGVIHGAGAGQDARFDRKRLDKVEKCIRAKVDGGIALAEATQHDPLEWFVGFGSISGRFGANGHTDYSLANDMLAKVVGRLRQQRPDVRCVTFHWHAWGDVGMATKPEAKLALEMIGMEFMPADEGLAHFLNELEHGGDMSEVLITDRRYIRKFFPGLGYESEQGVPTLPILDPHGTKTVGGTSLSHGEPWVVTLDPSTDRFLSEHRIAGIPTLPFVVALEMLAEAARFESGGEPIVVCHHAEAIQPLKFSGDDAMAIEVVRDIHGRGHNAWCLQADLRRRDGRIVESGLVRFRASFESGLKSTMPLKLASKIDRAAWDFKPIEYLGPDGPIYHGERFQMLRSIAVKGRNAVGAITTPSPIQLGGEHRPVHGWTVPCAVMDAMLYASAVLAFRATGRGSLPVRFEAIHFGRFPDPGEPLLVHSREIDQDESGMILAADLLGLNGDQLLALRGYRIHWLL